MSNERNLVGSTSPVSAMQFHFSGALGSIIEMTPCDAYINVTEIYTDTGQHHSVFEP